MRKSVSSRKQWLTYLVYMLAILLKDSVGNACGHVDNEVCMYVCRHVYDIAERLPWHDTKAQCRHCVG